MLTIQTYLNFPGNTEEAFLFYKSVFGGEFATLMRFRETPFCDKVPASEQEKIMHIALPIGDGSMLMATDALESMGQTVKPGNNYHITIQAKSREEADRCFQGLSADGRVTMPMSDAFWGDYFGMCTDQYGVQWMINYHPS